MNYSRFLSEVAKSREPSPLRYFTKYLVNPSPDLVNMSAGYPNPQTFPFDNMTVNLKGCESPMEISSERMKLACQYSNTQGLPDLLKWLTKLQTSVHKPPTASLSSGERKMEILVSPGSQDAIVRCLECLLNPGDSILLEEPTYPGSLAFMKPLQYNFMKVKGDSNGIVPDSLRDTLKAWSPEYVRSTVSKTIPRLLYTIPTAGNPTGTTISNDRKKEIYEIAQEYDLMILEDDPYYYLNFEKEQPKSFLSFDTDGRVIRTDSFSKILSSGMRVGFATGPNAVIQRMLLHMQSTVMQTSGLSQLVMLQLLEQWGIDGFMKHVKQVQNFYLERRDITLIYANKWLSGLAEWDVPAGGMFLWIKIPTMTDTTNFVKETLVEKELIIAPGSIFMSDTSAPSQYIRVSFSFAEEEKINVGFQRLGKAIKDQMK